MRFIPSISLIVFLHCLFVVQPEPNVENLAFESDPAEVQEEISFVRTKRAAAARSQQNKQQRAPVENTNGDGDTAVGPARSKRCEDGTCDDGGGDLDFGGEGIGIGEVGVIPNPTSVGGGAGGISCDCLCDGLPIDSDKGSGIGFEYPRKGKAKPPPGTWRPNPCRVPRPRRRQIDDEWTDGTAGIGTEARKGKAKPPPPPPPPPPPGC